MGIRHAGQESHLPTSLPELPASNAKRIELGGLPDTGHLELLRQVGVADAAVQARMPRIR